MKKFVRKTSELNFPRQRRSHTQRSESSQGQLNHSQTIIRNMTVHDLSISKTQNNSKSSSCLIFTLLKSKLQQNMKYSMDKMKQKLKQENKKKKCILRVLSIDNKIQWLNKRQALYNIKSFSKKYELKVKGLSILKNIFSIVNKKNKLYTIFKFTQLIKSHIKQQNVVLKNIEAKYNQNYIPENYMKQYRKFVKINSKNNKILLRNTQEVLEPSLNNLSNQLQARRIKKTLQSDTQIIVNIIKNYIQSFKQSSLKLQSCQNQKKQVENQRQIFSSQIRNMTKQIQNKLKEFKKYDFDLTQKCEILTENGYTLYNLRLLDRVINQQIRMWQGKGNYGYQYTSRIVLLKTSAIVLKKLLQNVQKQQNRKSDSSTGSPKKSSMNNTYIGGIKKRVSIIEELNCLEQSDIIEQIRKIIDQLIQKMKSQVIPQSLEDINNISKLNCKKNSSNSQLVSIYEKLEQILKIFFNKLLTSQKILSQSQKSIKKDLRNQQLIQNLQFENKYLHEEITKKISKIILQEQKLQFQKSVIKQLNAKLQTVQNQLVFCHKELSQKTKQLQQAHQKYIKSDKKIDQVDKQYKRFKKMMKESIDKNSSRDNSISNIMNKSLFHSGKKEKNKTLIRNQSQTIHPNRAFLDNSSILNAQINANHTMSVDEYFNEDNQNKKISSAKILKKQKNLEIMKNQLSDFMNESFYDEKPESNKTIIQLSSKLIQSQKLLNQYSDQMFKIDKKQASSYPKHLYLLPENISTLLYHIMLRVKKVPQNSELNTSLWNQLNSICQQSNGVQLLAGLEQYTVQWLIEKVVQPINNRLKKLDKSLVIIDEWNSLPKTPRKSPLKNTVQNPLAKTIKNNDILESQILEQ